MKSIIKYTLIGAFTMSLATACTNSFEDINTNPNEAHDKDMEKDNLSTGAFFTQMQNNVVLYKDGAGNESSDYQVCQSLDFGLVALLGCLYQTLPCGHDAREWLGKHLLIPCHLVSTVVRAAGPGTGRTDIA